jgi:UDP-3-O-[3-hydroxymyristoyl] glucosamine N-acyltransferase
MKMTVQEIADKLGGAAVEGNPAAVITGLSGIREAREGDLAYVANPKYAGAAAATAATAVIVAADWAKPCSATLIRVANPEKAFAQAAAWFAPPPIRHAPGIHPTAVVAPDAALGADVCVGPFCVIEPGASIGSRTVLQAGCYIGHRATVGDDCLFYPHVSVREYCRIGTRVILHNGVVIGSDGFGYAQQGERRIKIPQVGIVVVGDDVEMGANTTVDRARFGQTRIGNGVKIDNLVQIAHNVIVGDHAVIVAQAGIAGSSMIGARTILAGQVGIGGHTVIGPDVIIGAQSGVAKDVPAKTFLLGTPALPFERTSKIYAIQAHLPEWRDRLHAIEKRLDALDPKPAPPAAPPASGR